MIGIASFGLKAELLNVKCEGPKLHYIRQFNIESIDYLDSKETIVNNLKLEVELKSNGFASEEQVVTLDDLNGSLKVVKGMFIHDIYQLQLTNGKQGFDQVFVNLLIGHPSKVSSKIRFNGKEYKSKCLK